MLEHYTTMVQSSLNSVNEVAMVPALSAARQITFPPAVVANNNVGEGGTITVKQESSLLSVGLCASCGLSIVDRFILRVDDRDYHESCLACVECSAPLTRICYTRDCKLYCRADYERIYGVKCARCQQKLDCNDLVMRVQTRTVNGRPDGPIFHVECFVCYVCNEQLLRGSRFILRHGQPLCKREFQNDIYNMNSPQDDELLDDSRPRDGRRGPKRPRTILTSVQRRQFKASFEVSPKPCRKVREALAKDTGLSVRVVQVWFQNQRAKMKKLQRKAKTEPGADKEIKEERKPESPHSDHSHYMTALSLRDGESSNFTSATQPLNPNNPYSPDDAYPGHSGESFCSSDISIDGTEAGFELGDTETGQGPDGGHQTGVTPGSLVQPSGGPSVPGPGGPELQSLSQSLHVAVQHNPIDKLFMMQTSYFSSTEHP